MGYLLRRALVTFVTKVPREVINPISTVLIVQEARKLRSKPVDTYFTWEWCNLFTSTFCLEKKLNAMAIFFVSLYFQHVRHFSACWYFSSV